MQIDKTIGVAIIGAGFMGSHYARIFAQIPGARVVAVCDLIAASAEKLAGEVDAVAYPNADFERMFREQPEIDAVLVCTREACHREPALAALAAGKHLMVEKPLATTVDDAQAIMDAAQGKPGLVTMMGYTLRFDPRFLRLKRAVEENQVGDLIHIYARRTPNYAAMQRIGFRVELPQWVGVHDIDALRWIIGSEVATVAAVSSQKGLEEHGVKRAIVSLLTFENGVIATLENSWGPDLSGPNHQSTGCFRIQGTKGFAEVENLHQGVTIETAGGVTFPDIVFTPNSHGRIMGAYADQIFYFIDCIRRGVPSGVDLHDGLQGAKVAAAILKSLNSAGAPTAVA